MLAPLGFSIIILFKKLEYSVCTQLVVVNLKFIKFTYAYIYMIHIIYSVYTKLLFLVDPDEAKLL